MGPVILKPGQMFIVPKGIEHKPHADEECQIIMFEPETTLNTGDANSDMTIAELEWI
jgi:mannose-6-phosphate isomerase-like protein (cupin superfamily)